jgi:hypothetical protein
MPFQLVVQLVRFVINQLRAVHPMETQVVMVDVQLQHKREQDAKGHRLQVVQPVGNIKNYLNYIYG